MLLNLSNHQSKFWSINQIDAAVKEFGEINDLDFPNINPNAGTDEIKNLANEYFIKCKNLIEQSSDKNNAVHLMGEQTFSFCLVNMLIKNSIRCVASTTERMVEYNDGGKAVKFSFVKFREYVL